MTRSAKISFLVLSVAALSACGGGGGTSATLAGPTPNFTRWADVKADSTMVVGGISQSGSYTWDRTSDALTSATLDEAKAGATYSAKYDASGKIVSLTLTPVGSTQVSFTSPPDFLAAGEAISKDGSKFFVAVDPIDEGWEYQSFGIWNTGGGAGSGTYGAISAGAMTSGAAIPTSGSATYSGFAGGRYIDTSGKYWFAGSDMSATADFAARSINFATTQTELAATLEATTSTARPDLNLTGTLTYAPATNSITGNIKTQTTTAGLAPMTGSATARFYGPTAQEIGGTFSVRGTGIQGYAGAFGGKQIP